MFQYVNDNLNSQISRIHTALVVDVSINSTHHIWLEDEQCNASYINQQVAYVIYYNLL